MMNDDMKFMRVKWLEKHVMVDLLLSISFSVFGMLLIFGLGFVFPTINPYEVIKWIIIVAAAAFLFSFLKYIAYLVAKSKAMREMREEVKKEVKVKKTSRK